MCACAWLPDTDLGPAEPGLLGAPVSDKWGLLDLCINLNTGVGRDHQTGRTLRSSSLQLDATITRRGGACADQHVHDVVLHIHCAQLRIDTLDSKPTASVLMIREQQLYMYQRPGQDAQIL
jgi:hypothetical protein